MNESELNIARPHPLLEEFLKEEGLQWSSVLDLSGWQQFWDTDRVPPELKKDINFFEQWLEDGSHANMGFLEKNTEVRKDPRKILSDVKSIVSLIIPYAEGHQVRGKIALENPTSEHSILSKTARYARVPDYHRVIKKTLDDMMELWHRAALQSSILTTPVQWRVATDSLPFLDRAHARLARLGFIGKNTMLIRPGIGSFFFIAHILTSAPFEAIAHPNFEKPQAADAIYGLSCGDCTKCIDACPTQALQNERYLVSDRCLSYLTIEHRGLVEDKFHSHFSKQFYGCDICQNVCPYNFKTTELQTLKGLKNVNPALLTCTLLDVAQMNQKDYEKWFGGSAMTRAKYGGLVRNALYGLHAEGSVQLIEILKTRTHDPDPLIRDTVAQLMARIKNQNDGAPR